MTPSATERSYPAEAGPDGAAKFQIIGVAQDARIVTLRRHVGPALFFAALHIVRSVVPVLL